MKTVPPLSLALLLSLAPAAHASSAKHTFADAYEAVAAGDWDYLQDNEEAGLAWGASYSMMGVAAMFRATGDPLWLDRLARHADGVLAQRDDARGVTDYRGVSGACWRNQSYQDGDYCYVVHSGMIAWPIAEFARLVGDHDLGAELAYDGASFADKADAYIAAAEAVVAAHDDQWDASGYYVFRPDADFLSYAGVDLPLNQSNAMGRLLIALWQITGEEAYRGKAEALAARFKDQLSVGASGEYLWNYWGGAYASPGEDISHAALNVDFAVQAAEAGLVFTDADLDRFAATFTEQVYLDDATTADFVGGGSVNTSSYVPQAGRWLRLSPRRWSIYAAVHDRMEDLYGGGIGPGSLMAIQGLLAEYEPFRCEPFFYYVDWADLGSARVATAYGANVLTRPHALDEPCLVPLTLDARRDTTIQQWDGADYHDVQRWAASSSTRTRLVAYEPLWPYVYYDDGVLFQLHDSFVEDDGVVVAEPTVLTPPTITSIASGDDFEVDRLYTYAAAGEGDGPLWWSLTVFPPGARVDARTGEVTWTPDTPGAYDFTVRLENDVGAHEQYFAVVIVDPDAEDTADTGYTNGHYPTDSYSYDYDSDFDTADTRSRNDSATPGDPYDEGYPTQQPCGCGKGAAGSLLLLPLLAGVFSRRRRDSGRMGGGGDG